MLKNLNIISLVVFLLSCTKPLTIIDLYDKVGEEAKILDVECINSEKIRHFSFVDGAIADKPLAYDYHYLVCRKEGSIDKVIKINESDSLDNFTFYAIKVKDRIVYYGLSHLSSNRKISYPINGFMVSYNDNLLFFECPIKFFEDLPVSLSETNNVYLIDNDFHPVSRLEICSAAEITRLVQYKFQGTYSEAETFLENSINLKNLNLEELYTLLTLDSSSEYSPSPAYMNKNLSTFGWFSWEISCE